MNRRPTTDWLALSMDALIDLRLAAIVRNGAKYWIYNDLLHRKNEVGKEVEEIPKGAVEETGVRN